MLYSFLFVCLGSWEITIGRKANEEDDPYTVGGKVDMNKVTVTGGVAPDIPVPGIIKVVSETMEPLQPLGYILNESGISSEDGWMQNFRLF
jgi:hypothetical protein